MARVLLLETLNEDLHRHHRAEPYPFLLGLAQRIGWWAGWWVVPVPRETMHSGARFVVELPAATAAVLGAALAEAAPDVVVCHDRPGPELARLLAAAAPAARVCDLTQAAAGDATLGHDTTVRAVVEGVFGASAAGLGVDGAAFLLDEAPPCYERRFLGFGSAAPPDPPVRLAVDPSCVFRRRLRTNRLFAALDEPLVREHRGCSFCPRVDTGGAALRTPTADLVLRQIEAHQRAAAPRDGRYAYDIEETPLTSRLAAFLAAVVDRRVAPSTFTVMLRADVLLGQRDGLERVLPRLRDAGHQLCLISIGAENFSPAENERFNKGLRPDQLWDCFALLEDLARRFPDTFRPDAGRFASILFTPWTTPEDLLANVEAARRIGPLFLQTAMATRLQLWDRLPITALARADGLLADRFGSAGDVTAVCVSQPDIRERPWRFADPRMERIHQLLIRLDPLPEHAVLAADDPLLAEVRAERAGLPHAVRGDYVGLVQAVVEAVAVLGPDADVATVFRDAAGRFRPTGHRLRDEARPLTDADWPVVLVRLVEEHRPTLLGGYRLAGATPGRDDDGRPLCHLAFRAPDRQLDLVVGDRVEGAPAWLATERFTCLHRGALPEDDERERRLARSVLRAFDRRAPAAGVASLVD